MSVQTSVKVEGFEELFKAMDQLKEEIGKGKTDRIWRDVLKKAMQPVLQGAKDKAPKDTGQMADHIYLSVHRPKSRDVSGKYYDGEMYMARVTVSPVREDTKYRMILNKRGRFQTISYNKKPVAVSQEFGNARTPAHPFLRTSLESNSQEVVNLLQSLLRLKIEEITRGLAKKGQ